VTRKLGFGSTWRADYLGDENVVYEGYGVIRPHLHEILVGGESWVLVHCDARVPCR